MPSERTPRADAGDGSARSSRRILKRRFVIRGQVFAECFSVVAPEGEVGCHPLAAVTEIGRAEFEAARERGWKP